MAELLKKHQDILKPLHKGDKVTGKITKLTSQEILMDISYKTEALVIEKERRLFKNLLSVIKVGDTVTANVISPESEKGFPVVTLRQYVENLIWQKLEKLQKDQEKIEVTIREITKGGLLVDSKESIQGFLPSSHIAISQNPQNLVGQKIKVNILELDRENKKVIFSQKAVVSTEDFKKATKTWKAGEKVKATIATITTFGLFVSIPNPENPEKYIDGLIHISEIAWDKTSSELTSLFTVGQEIESVITGFDDNAKRVDLSIKRLTTDPFETAIKEKSYEVDQKVSGTVIKVTDSGVTLNLGSVNDIVIEGTIRKDKIPAGTTYTEGQKITATISQIDSKKHRILLTPVLLEKPLGYR